MRPGPVIVDTNVVVAGLLTTDPDAATAKIVDQMLVGGILFAISSALLSEYRAVLLRPPIQTRHRLDEGSVDDVLTALVANALVRRPAGAPQRAPDTGDQHIWDLQAAVPGAVLITGDSVLLAADSAPGPAVTPRGWLERVRAETSV